MKMNIADQFMSVVDDTKNRGALNISQGEQEATLRRLNNRYDSMGVIRNAIAKGNTLYVVAYRVENLHKNSTEHKELEYFNCSGDPAYYGLGELFMPVMNVDLSRDIVDPRKFIGGKVLVTEVDNIPVKVEFIGQLDEINESPFKVARTVLRSIRNFIGPTTPLDDSSALSQEIVRGFGATPEQMKKVMELTLENTKHGEVFVIQGQGVYSQDTSEPPEGVVVIKSTQELSRHLEDNPMKTKKCHLPIKIFGAR